jgi:hypothetical protein
LRGGGLSRPPRKAPSTLAASAARIASRDVGPDVRASRQQMTVFRLDGLEGTRLSNLSL